MRNESLGEQIEAQIRDRDITKPLLDEIVRLESEVERLRGQLERLGWHEYQATIATLRAVLRAARLYIMRGDKSDNLIDDIEQALATAQDCDCEGIILKAGGHRVDCPLNEAA